MPAEDRWLSAGALVASAVLAVNLIQGGAAPRIDPPLTELPLAFDDRVNELAEAIAVSGCA